MPHTPALLVILDGYGIAKPGPGNAVALANSPFLDELFSTRPTVHIAASGEAVGLPAGQMGNSEVGHLNIGAGRVVHQELSRINRAVADGSLFENQVIANAIDKAIAANGTVHFMGLLSDGGVHSEMTHLQALMRMAAQRGAKRLRVHAFMDGRDVPPSSGAGYLSQMQEFCDELSATAGTDARIATVCGRFYAMDRDNRWDRVECAWRTLVLAEGEAFTNAQALMDNSYAAGITDEFVVPAFMEGAHTGMHDGDALLFFNFRPDRAREISRAFTEADFTGFERPVFPALHFVCMTEYDPTIPAPVAFPKTFPEFVLADYLSSLGLRQLHIAETEKYAHVTFFLNGGVEASKEGEERVLINSPRDVATYDLKPQMSAPEVTDALERAILEDRADVYIVNYANCDMVGHTGALPAAVAAVEAVDKGVKRVVQAIRSKGGVALVTADHGNAERMLSDDGETPFTAHTLSPVPLCLAVGEGSLVQTADGKLADVAPTLVSLMGLDVPSMWTGRSLLA